MTGASQPTIGSGQQPTEKIIEADPPTTTEAVQELTAGHSIVSWHLKQIGKVKKLSE